MNKNEVKAHGPDRKLSFHEQLAADINEPPKSEKEAVKRIAEGPIPGIGRNPEIKDEEIGEPQGFAAGKTVVKVPGDRKNVGEPGPVVLEGNDLTAAQEAQRRQREKAEDPPRGHGVVNTTSSVVGQPEPGAPVGQPKPVDKHEKRK